MSPENMHFEFCFNMGWDIMQTLPSMESLLIFGCMILQILGLLTI